MIEVEEADEWKEERKRKEIERRSLEKRAKIRIE